MLRRLLSYAEKIVCLSECLAAIGDRREKPRIATSVVLRSLLVLFWARLGSLNALEQTQAGGFWRKWLGRVLPSADTLGRIPTLVDPDDLRLVLQRIYTCLRRNKALGPTSHGLMALVIDGHESHSTYHRHCDGCLERPVKTKFGYRTQYYHRCVTAMLLSRDFPLLLDAEPIRAGEDEVEATLRLLRRVLVHFPRAFDVVLGDALYTDPRFYNLLLEHRKDVLTVLKRNIPELLEDAHALFDASEAQLITPPPQERQVWDQSGFLSWPELGQPVRVVRSRETKVIHRQIDDADETLLSQWLWVTTLSTSRAATLAVVELGHARWDIENLGFNETTNRWHADHVYRHEATAILTFWFLAMIAYNLFHVFYYRNLKPPRRRRLSYIHVARCLASDLYQTLPSPTARAP